MAIGRIGSRDSATVIETYRYVASGGETSLSGADAGGATLNYPLNYEVVFLNGVRLVRGDDYTASTGTGITGLTALSAGDVVEILVFQAVDVANAVTSTYVNSTFVPNALINAAGDLLVGSADDTVGRLALGNNGEVLTVDTAGSGVNKVKWAAVGGGKDDADNIIAVQVFG